MNHKKALITGISGQDGAYLAEYLLSLNYEVIGLQRRSSSNEDQRLKYLNIIGRVNLLEVDLCDFSSVTKIIQNYQFDEIYNLAAQSFVAASWSSPITTSQINSLSVTNILEAIRHFSPKTKFYQASTSEMFGKIQEDRQSEQTPFYPRSPYGVTKLYAHWMVINYRESFNLFACSGILFNHESPLRGGEFVTKKIVRHLCQAKIDETVILRLGNLYAKRDWGFAGDYVKAMHAMLQHDRPDDYVIGSGQTISVKEFCNLVLSYLQITGDWSGEGLEEKFEMTNGRVLIEVSSEFFRPAEVDVLLADPAKAKKILNWSPSTSIEQLTRLMIESELRSNKTV